MTIGFALRRQNAKERKTNKTRTKQHKHTPTNKMPIGGAAESIPSFIAFGAALAGAAFLNGITFKLPFWGQVSLFFFFFFKYYHPSS